jgi:hypothetical protein
LFISRQVFSPSSMPMWRSDRLCSPAWSATPSWRPGWPADPGRPASYADHFDDLIDEKAAHLGLTRGKMEELLNKGNATLLTYLMATIPAAYEAFQVWSEQSHGNGRPSSDTTQPSVGAP